jgi:N-acetyl sugar amidotransferase
MKHCSRCLMPETAESLTFDEHGVCSVCRQIEYKHSQIDWNERGKALDELLERFRGKGQYDCIVPFSGGKDSTFTLWYLVKVKKLRPLVVRFDHGFLRRNLIDNATRTFRTLGVDVQHFTPNWQVVRKLMFESLRRRGDFCWHCHTGIFSYPMWVSIWQKIPLIIWGEPTAEYASFYRYDEEEEVDERRFNAFVNLGINAEDMLGMLDNSVSDYPVTDRDLMPYTYPPAEQLRGVRSVLLGSYIPWDVKNQVELIKRELGWKGDQVEGVPDEYGYEKIECFMQGVRDYIKFLKRGFGRTTHLVSIDIRNGRKTRAEGEVLVKQHDGVRPAALDLFLDYLGLKEEDFLKLIEPHVVAPHVMPSCEECMQNEGKRIPRDYDSWTRITGDRAKDADEDRDRRLRRR